MRCPCLECDLRHEDKNNQACADCDRRLGYVAHIDEKFGGVLGLYEGVVTPMEASGVVYPGFEMPIPQPEEPAVIEVEVRMEENVEKQPELFRCNACGVLKPRSSFFRQAKSRSGIQGTCKPCRYEQNRESYKKRRQKMKNEKPAAVTAAAPAMPAQPETAKTVRVMSIDFSGHPDLFVAVQQLAKDEYRPVDMQVLWMIKQAIGIDRNTRKFFRPIDEVFNEQQEVSGGKVDLAA